MALKDWYETFYADDCLKIGSWEEMTDYIQHSACTDFTIYSECTSGGQAFKFTTEGTLSMLTGGADSGDDLGIYANDNDTYPFITLEGNEGINLDVANDDEIVFKEGGSQFVKFDRTGVISEIYGGTDAFDAIRIFANDNDSYPFVHLAGGSDISLEVANEDEIFFKEGGNQFFKFDRSGADSYLYGGGTTGEDLHIYANSINNCSMIKLDGNSGITCKVKATSVFEVSTCSDEILFEIDSAAGNHYMDFHCLDAVNFVLENRTSDPSSPTCTGQIWFRTDLV